MSDQCFRPDDLASVLAHLDDAPVRAHLEACPACRALVASYRAFLAGDSATGPEVAAAEEDLCRRIEEMTSAPPALDRKVVRPRALRWWDPAGWSGRRGLAYGLASAAAVVVVAILLLGPSARRTHGPLYRGEAPVAAVGSSAVRLDDGSIRLTWRAHPEAAAYLVRVLSADLTPLVSLTVTSDTTTVLEARTLGGFERGGGPLLWDTAPIVRGDTLSAGAPQVLPRE
jgi:hypothetical protein